MKLPVTFYQESDVVSLAKSLIGMFLFTNFENVLTGGIITETEAYAGINDRASHAFGGRQTQRTEIMYKTGGVSYVYLCYGAHCLFNVVTGKINEPYAILIRGIFPTTGLEKIGERTGHLLVTKSTANGPGKLTKALGISLIHNGIDLTGNHIWIENQGKIIDQTDIVSTERIGVKYAGEDAKLLYRFLLKDNSY